MSLITYARESGLAACSSDDERAALISAWQQYDIDNTHTHAHLMAASADKGVSPMLMTYKRQRQLAACRSAAERAELQSEWQARGTTPTLTHAVTATRTPTPTREATRTMPPRLNIRPVPDSITEGRRIRDAKLAGTFKPEPEPASVTAFRAAQSQHQVTERKAQAVLEAARRREYRIPDSLEDGRAIRDARLAAFRARNPK